MGIGEAWAGFKKQVDASSRNKQGLWLIVFSFPILACEVLLALLLAAGLATPRTGGGVYFLVVAGVGLLASAGLFLLQCIPPRRFPRLQLGLCIAASAWWFAGMVAFAVRMGLRFGSSGFDAGWVFLLLLFIATTAIWLAVSFFAWREVVAARRPPPLPLHSLPESFSALYRQNLVYSYDSLAIEHKLGEGSYGEVHLARWDRGGRVAVKRLLAANLSPGQTLIGELVKEAGLMSKLRHANLVELVGVCAEPPCLITKYYVRGNLNQLLLDWAFRDPQNRSCLTWGTRLIMALDAAKGMLFLHSQDPAVLHRDLKPDNLLVDDGFRVVIADLNLAGVAEPAAGRSAAGSGSACGNPHWIAPELMAPRARATKESDVFAFAYLLWAVLTWRHPWRGVPECAVQLTVCRGGRPTVPSLEELPGPAPLSPATVPAFIALMTACWAQAPEERPTFAAIEDTLRDIMEDELKH